MVQIENDANGGILFLFKSCRSTGNYLQLVLLMPGATPNQLTQAADGFSLNGNRTTQNKFLVDGLDNNNYLLGLTTGSTQAIHRSMGVEVLGAVR